MIQFYSSIIFVGIILIVFAFVWIIIDKRRSLERTRLIDEKREKVIQAINDADEIVDEMNKFSDYISEKVEEDGEKISRLIVEADLRIEKLQDILNVSATDNLNSDLENQAKRDLEIIGQEEEFNEEENTEIEQELEDGKQNSKVISINNRYFDVYRLYRRGMPETEIAKTLDMGRGEVQLILGLNITGENTKTG